MNEKSTAQAREFFHLMGIPLPVPENHAHYLEALSKVYDVVRIADRSYEMKYLPWCEENGFSSPEDYRKNKAIPDFLNWANGSSTLDSLVLMVKSKYEFTPMDKLKEVKGELLLSIKMIDADFSVMKLSAFQRGIHIPETWDALCDELKIEPFLKNSQVFMNECFAQYEPEKCLELQKHVIMNLVKGLKDEEFVYISPTEVIIKYPKKGVGGNLEIINGIFGLTSCIKFNLIPFRDENVFDIRIEKKRNEEKESRLGVIRADKWKVTESQRYEEAAKLRDQERVLLKELKDEYQQQSEVHFSTDKVNSLYSMRIKYVVRSGKMIEIERSLIGVPDSKYYMYHRTVIMRELLEKEDLSFMHEGEIAQWTCNTIDN